MGSFAAGQVVLLAFPYSDLTRDEPRPVLLVAYAGRQDWITCLITSNPYADSRAVTLTEDDFVAGGLRLTSYLRPGKLFTANELILGEHLGTLRDETLEKVRATLVAVIQGEAST